MAIQANSIWAIDGETMSGDAARLFLRTATRNSRGIAEMGDLAVTAQSTPNGTVNVSDGAAIVTGREVAWQGSYWCYNNATAVVTVPSNLSGSTVYRLIYLMIEDPTFASSPWIHNPATDPCASLNCSAPVSSGANDVGSGTSGIPLALIAIPPTTSAITSGMITDLRQMANPRTQTQAFSAFAGSGADYACSQATYKVWPAINAFNVPVPLWASSATIQTVAMAGVYSSSSGYGSSSDVYGAARITLGGTQATAGVQFFFDHAGYINGKSRITLQTAGTVSIPLAMRGTSQTVQMETEGFPSGGGGVNSDAYTSVYTLVVFNEVPVALTDAGSRLAF